jgi:hypothetical protein
MPSSLSEETNFHQPATWLSIGWRANDAGKVVSVFSFPLDVSHHSSGIPECRASATPIFEKITLSGNCQSRLRRTRDARTLAGGAT